MSRRRGKLNKLMPGWIVERRRCAGGGASEGPSDEEIRIPLRSSADAYVSAVGALIDRMQDEMGSESETGVDWDAVKRLKLEAVAVGSSLGADGRVLSPSALCRALDVERGVYDQVVCLYADDGPRAERQPCRIKRGFLGRPSHTETMLDVLVQSGDVRFAQRRERAERGAVGNAA